MEDAVFSSSEKRSPDHHFTIPERPRKAQTLTKTSPRMFGPKLIHQAPYRLKEDECVSNHASNLEGPREYPAVTSMKDASEQIDKIPMFAQCTEQASLYAGGDPFTPEHILVWNPSALLSKHSDDKSEEEGEQPLFSDVERLKHVADLSAYILRERHTSASQDAFLPADVLQTDWQPESMFAEQEDWCQHKSPGVTIQYDSQPSTQMPAYENTPRPYELEMEDTWRLPIVGVNATRRSLFMSVFNWLTGK